MPKLYNLSDKFKNIIEPKLFDDISFLTANQLRATISQRVFTKGNITEGSAGKYVSEPYKKKREKKGRQIAYKDFEMNGDLRKSFKLLKNKKGVCEVGFNNSKEALIAKGQDEQMRRLRGAEGEYNVIFSASEPEIKEATKLAVDKITKTIEKRIKQQFQ
jgi:hypothetical protein